MGRAAQQRQISFSIFIHILFKNWRCFRAKMGCCPSRPTFDASFSQPVTFGTAYKALESDIASKAVESDIASKAVESDIASSSTSSKDIRSFESCNFKMFPRVWPDWAAPRNAVSWTPKSENDISDDDSKNMFMVNVHNVTENPVSFLVHGRDTIESLCGRLFTKIGQLDVSAVFQTVEDKPLLIPSGTLLGAIYKSHGGGRIEMDLRCTLVKYQPDHRFVICSPSQAPSTDAASILPGMNEDNAGGCLDSTIVAGASTSAGMSEDPENAGGCLDSAIVDED